MTRTLLRRGRRIATGFVRRAPAKSLRPGDVIRTRAGMPRTIVRVVFVPPFMCHPPIRVLTWYGGEGVAGEGWLLNEAVRVVRRAAAQP